MLLDRRVDDLFVEVASALADTGAYVVRVEYDVAYSFPRLFWLGRGLTRSWGVLIESFAAAP